MQSGHVGRNRQLCRYHKEEAVNKFAETVERLKGEFGAASYGGLPIILSEKDMAEVELQLGYSLPEDCREFLRDYGGYLFHGILFPLKDNPDGIQESSLLLFYGIDKEHTDGLIEIYKQWRDSFVRWPVDLIPGVRLVRPISDDATEISWLPELLPIATDAGNNQICLALAGTRPCAVFLWMNAPGNDLQNIYLIADSFEEFLNALYLPEKQL